MSRIRHFRRLAGVLAGLTSALLAFAASAPAALASTSPGRTWPLSWADPPLPLRHGAGPVPVYQVPARTDVTGATPWQIAVIAAVAALAVAAILVLRDRAGRGPHDGHRGPGGAPAQATRAISWSASPERPWAKRAAPAGQQTPTQRSR